MHCKAFVNNSSSNVQLSKTQQSKIIQSAGFLGRLLGLLLKADLPLIKKMHLNHDLKVFWYH